MTLRLSKLYSYMTFHPNSFNGFQLTEWMQNRITNDQREITPIIYKAELWFLCMTHCLNVLYKFCISFIQVELMVSKENNSNIIQRVNKSELWFL